MLVLRGRCGSLDYFHTVGRPNEEAARCRLSGRLGIARRAAVSTRPRRARDNGITSEGQIKGEVLDFPLVAAP